MSTSIHQRIKMLIEETSDAFSSCGSINADYAEFASLALSEFKHVLRNPRLTKRQLTQMLRTGMYQHKMRKDTKGCWATFMAKHVAKTANKNIQPTVTHITAAETAQ